MGVLDRIGETSRGVSEKLSQKYRDHVGEDLLKKQAALEAFEASLKERERQVLEAEKEQKKYYRIPRWIINVPVIFAVIAVGIWGYNSYKSETAASTPSSVTTSNSVDTNRLVSASDDYTTYASAFERGARELMKQGRCSPEDFREMGGWVKSTNHKNKPVYFTYCGGMTVSDRIYLDASSGRIFK